MQGSCDVVSWWWEDLLKQSFVLVCRALFGDAEECITTIQSWQQMTHEAKWVGRALYDAEDIVLRALYPGIAAPLPTN